MKNVLLSLLASLVLSSPALAGTWYVAPAGNDANPGTAASPFLTVQKAQSAAAAGDTLWIRGGRYGMQESQVAAYTGIWAYVTHLTKSGEPGRRINYWAYPGEKPVFDYSNVKPANYRINAFEVSGSWLHLRGIEVVGLQVTITTSNTQSICFANNGGSHNVYEQLSMHDGQGIGFFLTKGSYNLVLNCDAYRNYDYTSRAGGGANGGNVDGFGNHPAAGSVGNVFRGCRAWFNSDDGYDCISAHESTVFENCWAFYNGYSPGFVGRADGNGFKAGGYGKAAPAVLPQTVPRNVIRFCLAVRNKANGFYSNHHLEGSDWTNNTAYLNGTNFNLLNRKAKNTDDYLTDVPGYNHTLRNNVSFAPRTIGNDITSVDRERCVIDHNTFGTPGITVTASDFLSLDTALLTAPRQDDGSLPVTDFLRPAPGSNLVDKGLDLGFPFAGAAPDIGLYENGLAALPLAFSTFTATAENGQVILQWESAGEGPVKGWTVERRATGGDWKKAGFVPRRGTPGSKSVYRHTEKKVEKGSFDYRLQQTGPDGRELRSAVVSSNGQ